MKPGVLVIIGVVVGLVLGAIAVGIALRGDPAAVVEIVRPAPADADRTKLIAADTAAFLAEAEHPGDAPAMLRRTSEALAPLADDTPLGQALQNYRQTLPPLAAELQAAADEQSGLSGATRRTWNAIKSLAGDERDGPSNANAITARTRAVEAAAADLAATADDAGLDLERFCPNLPGVESLTPPTQ